MKRPQGFDRSAPAAVPTPKPAPETGAERRSARGASDSHSAPAPTTTITQPIPTVGAGSKGTREQVVPPAPLRPDDGRSALPSDREITRALRNARKERARIERGEVRRFTKRSRRRRIAWITAFGTLAALVLAVALTAFSPLMALRTIDVAGTVRLDRATVQRALADQLGRPLPLVDQAAIRGDLAAFPLIRSYSVESHPPNTIVVRIVERDPIGVLQKGSTFTLVDAAKVAIATSATRPAGFPLITATGGSAESDAASGFAAAAAVLTALPADLRANVDTISARTKDDVSFTLRDHRATVVWGSADDSALKTADLAALLKSAAGASTYDVSSPHSVTTG